MRFAEAFVNGASSLAVNDAVPFAGSHQDWRMGT
jgi:hypothetical protein